jgi:hypothetical protein
LNEAKAQDAKSMAESVLDCFFVLGRLFAGPIFWPIVRQKRFFATVGPVAASE